MFLKLKQLFNLGNKNKKVFVGISGGVDSAVSALILKNKGYDVTGVFIKTWTPDYIECTQKEDRLDAMRVCSQLDIPFLELNLEKEYKEKVIDLFLEEYKNNRVPNPDIMCNKYIKFDAFYEYARAAGARIATGHYAKIDYDKKTESYFLSSPKDESKDQTYFLYQIKKEILKDVIFPLSDITKEEVRKIAKNNNLWVADKKDSQGICMLGGDISPKDFLIRELNPKKGNVLNEKGQIIGEHDGVILYTIGERHGFRIFKNETPDKDFASHYVIEKDFINNNLIVSGQDLYRAKDDGVDIKIKDANLFFNNININDILYVQYRYRGEKLRVSFDVNDLRIVLEKEDLYLKKYFVPGQSLVIYNKKGICLGGGVIY